ncbi:hypothetical protein ACAW74_12935 [Fibrella sp. WM1]|uniref:hypothetical protein n=1 Tax=Fibrella musci TaxID=3242485 RepID=UPI00351FBF3E
MKLLVQIAIGCLMLFLIGCLQQELTPTPDQNTRSCLIRQVDSYDVQGGNWSLRSQVFDYNKAGDPIRQTFIDSKRNITKIITIEYDGLRPTRINQYEGEAETPANLTMYKTLVISANYDVIIDHTFERRDNNQYAETVTLAKQFFRNQAGALKLRRTDFVTPAATPDSIGTRLGTYWRNEYDAKNENVVQRFFKQADWAQEQVQYTQGGFDMNGRSPWNASLWLAYTRSLGPDFRTGEGFWSENNIALQAGGTGQTTFFYNYEINSAGFPCVGYVKRADNVVEPGQSYYYYYNCPCSR